MSPPARTPCSTSGSTCPKPGAKMPHGGSGAHVPDGTRFATKTELGAEMVTGAIGAGVPFSWVAGDEVYGRSSRLRAACEQDEKGYLLAVPVNFQVRLPSGRKAAVC